MSHRKLTPAELKAIYDAKTETVAALARQYGVSRRTIQRAQAEYWLPDDLPPGPAPSYPELMDKLAALRARLGVPGEIHRSDR